MPGCIHTYVYSSVNDDVGLDVVVYVMFRTPKKLYIYIYIYLFIYLFIYIYYYIIFYIYIYIIIEIWNTVTSMHSYTDMAATT